MATHFAEPDAEIAGPYWVRTNTNGGHDVCGRHGAIVRRYRADQAELADADCKRLMKTYWRDYQRLHDAAPVMLDALKGARDYLRNPEGFSRALMLEVVEEAIAKAEAA